ncbi:DUF1836 domain-containing protein [Lentibacillus sediminis]|uniref:DUF1836 domain-containing protein n=1 Tax=Lentibacillus sediminis TaxID=1940529 RepID=UPI000C1C21B6|nr:DUF1836 domain-containing protein [Lentibacillus sediminis]
MENTNQLLDGLHLDSQLSLEDIPDLDLYMDQVIQLFEKTFADTKRNDEEKVLTKTMINNYAKGKLFFPVQNKKYTKDHLIFISMIYQMKGALSINDVKTTLNQLNTKMTDEAFDLQRLYQTYLELAETSVQMVTENIKERQEEVSEQVAKLDDPDSKYLQQLLSVTMLANMSNFYRRAAEKIVDDIAAEREEKE